jgi:hypothetical protein
MALLASFDLKHRWSMELSWRRTFPQQVHRSEILSGSRQRHVTQNTHLMFKVGHSFLQAGPNEPAA